MPSAAPSSGASRAQAGVPAAWKCVFWLRGGRNRHSPPALLFALNHHIRATAQYSGQQQEGNVRHTGYQAHQTDDGSGKDQHLGPGKELAHELATDILIRTYTAHYQARCGGDDERRDLRHQTIPDGKQRVGLGSSGHVQVMLKYADKQAAELKKEQDAKAAREQAKRDAEAQKKAEEEAKRELVRQRDQQRAKDEAAAQLKAAQERYDAVAKTTTSE